MHRCLVALVSFVLALSLLASASIAAPPSIPGDIDGPADDADGIYTVSWNASIGTVTAYKLEENSAEIYAGLNRAFKMPAARSGAKTSPFAPATSPSAAPTRARSPPPRRAPRAPRSPCSRRPRSRRR